MFQSALKTNMTPMPYNGTAPALTDLIGGQVDVICEQAPNASRPRLPLSSSKVVSPGYPRKSTACERRFQSCTGRLFTVLPEPAQRASNSRFPAPLLSAVSPVRAHCRPSTDGSEGPQRPRQRSLTLAARSPLTDRPEALRLLAHSSGSRIGGPLRVFPWLLSTFAFRSRSEPEGQRRKPACLNPESPLSCGWCVFRRT
jgi:hypothetical protein